MKFIELFDKYFLIMTLIICLYVYFIDSRNFKKDDKMALYKKSRILTWVIGIVGVLMFLVNKLV